MKLFKVYVLEHQMGLDGPTSYLYGIYFANSLAEVEKVFPKDFRPHGGLHQWVVKEVDMTETVLPTVEPKFPS